MVPAYLSKFLFNSSTQLNTIQQKVITEQFIEQLCIGVEGREHERRLKTTGTHSKEELQKGIWNDLR